jgi:hypothetical protein
VSKITSERTIKAEESYKFVLTKDPNFIDFGLKRTPIAIYSKSNAITRT